MASPKLPAFDGVYRDEFSFVYRVLRYLGVNDADVEDLAHDVFVVVHRRLPDYDPTRPLRPWLFGIAYRTVRRHIDRHSRRSAIDANTLDEAGNEARHAPATDEVVADGQAWERLRDALQDLPYEQRAVVIMHDIEEHTAPEIATQLEVPVNTVYSRLRLARKRLAGALRPGGIR